MLESALVQMLVGFVGAIAGCVVSVAVMREQITHIRETAAKDQRTTSDRLAIHEAEIKDIKARAHCGPCDSMQLERRQYDETRYAALEKGLEALRGEMRSDMADVKHEVVSCFDRLAEEMRK